MINIVEMADAERSNIDEGRTDRLFDAYDNKGRQFGAMVRTFRGTWVARTSRRYDFPEYRASCAERAAKVGTEFFGFRSHAMRGGSMYGASQRDRIFATAAERDAAIEKYFATAERGALKNKARVR